MPLDRMSIEKKDFPIGRRGYDPEAVDSHLRAIAEEVEELKRSSSQRSETLASVASQRVQAIVDAAEQSAAEIRRQAEEEARAIRDEASGEAQRERDEAARDAQDERRRAADDAQREREEAMQQSRDYVNNVSEATAQMRARLESMESELGALVETLRTGGDRLAAELGTLEAEMRDLGVVAGGRARADSTAAGEAPIPEAGELEGESSLGAVEPEPLGAAGPVSEDELPSEPMTAAELEAEPELGAEGELEPEAEPELGLEADRQVELTGEPGTAGMPRAGDDDLEGARLIALNMALNGTPRNETDRYLAENFELADRQQLLDEVYASVEG